MFLRLHEHHLEFLLGYSHAGCILLRLKFNLLLALRYFCLQLIHLLSGNKFDVSHLLLVQSLQVNNVLLFHLHIFLVSAFGLFANLEFLLKT